MRQTVAGILILMCVFVLGAFSAAENQMGIADKYKVSFTEKILVANTLLPKGDYEVRHVMEGPDHIMIFRQLGTHKPIQVRAKCTLVPLVAKASRDEEIYLINASNQRVLQQLVFKGDTAKHVF
jgi:hypothetical protein